MAIGEILEDGTMAPVILENGEASDVVPTRLFVGSDDKIYVAFGGYGVTINGEACRLVRGQSNGVAVECYGPDNGLNVALFSSSNTGGSGIHPGDHFDADNNFYFVDVEDDPDSNGSLIIFKKLSSDGVITNIIQYSDLETGISHFVVLQDGTIIFAGTTFSTGVEFTRRTTATGGVENLDFSLEEGAIVATNGDLFNGSTRITIDGSNIDVSDLHVLSGGTVDISALVTSTIPSISSLFEDTRGNVYSELTRIYPGEPVMVASINATSDEEDSGIGGVTSAKTSGNFLYYSALDADNNNIFRRIDLTDETFPETDLLNGEDIEVYRFQAWSTGNILFGGLRLSDNQLILGEINGETLEMTVRTTTTTRIDELVLIE